MGENADADRARSQHAGRYNHSGGRNSAYHQSNRGEAYDPTADRETIRGTIALALVWTLVGVIGAVVLTGLVTMYACHGGGACNTETMDLKTVRAVIELVLTPLIGLVGAVTGFYFGEKSASGKSGG